MRHVAPEVRAQLDDAELLRRLYVDEGLSTHTIGERIHCAQHTVLLALRRHGIELRGYGPPLKGAPARTQLDDAELMRRLYVDERQSAIAIAARLDVSKRTVLSALQRHGIERRSTGDARRAQLDANWIRREYESGRTSTEIGADLGVGAHVIRNRLREVGVEARGRTDVLRLRHAQARDARLNDAAWLRDMYIVRRRSANDIAKEQGMTRAAVYEALVRHHIERRGFSESKRLSILNAPPRPRVWHHGEITRDRLRAWREQSSFVSAVDYGQLDEDAAGFCPICSRPLVTAHYDHVWPISDRGAFVAVMPRWLATAPATLATFLVALAVLDRTNRGTTETENMIALCPTCNATKGAARLADLPAAWWTGGRVANGVANLHGDLG